MDDRYSFINCSVIVLVYNCEVEDLVNTLKSVLRQKNVNMEIIIADDCSKIDYKSCIDNCMEKNSNYQYIKNKGNIGTVKNMINAVKKCNYKYVKAIGCGDILYADNVLFDTFSYMKLNEYHICFTKGKAYKFVDNSLYVSNFDSPYIVKPYIINKTSAILRNLIIYSDQISGALTFYTKEKFIQYLEIIENKIIYTEDYIPRLIALNEENIGFYGCNTVLYQYGTGISTKKSKNSLQRIADDELSFIRLIKKYSKDPCVKKYLMFCSLKSENSLVRFIKKCLISPHYFIYYIISTYRRRNNFSKWTKMSDYEELGGIRCK